MSKVGNKLMKQKNKDTYSAKNNMAKNSILFAFPIIMTIGIVPLLVGPYLDNIDEMTAKYWITNQYVSFYDHHSAIAMIVLLLIMSVITFFSFQKSLIPKDKPTRVIMLSLLVFSLLTIISTIFAYNKNLAIWGAPDRYEGLLVQLSYMMSVVYIILFFRDVDAKKYIMRSVLFVAGVVSILGIVQMFGKNLLFTEPLNSFINLFSNANVKVTEGLSDPSMRMSLTFGNSNYVGSYVALVLPILCVTVLGKKNRPVERILAAIFGGLTLLILFASRSQAGLVGVLVGGILFLLLNIKLFLIDKKRAVAVLLGLVILLLGVFLMLPDDKKWLVTNIGEDIKAFLMKPKDISEFDPTYGLAMYDFQIDGKDMKISTINGILNLHVDADNNLIFSDQDGNPLSATYDNEQNNYTLSPPFENISYRYAEGESSELEGIQLSYLGSNFILLENNFKEGLFLVDDRFNRIEFVHAPHWGFEGKEKIGSGRGYIWSRSIPMLSDTIIKGYGPDNFLVAFPQHDYWAKTYVYSNSQMITDKPHNMYLQWGINNGVVALMSLLVVFGIYLFRSGRELFRWNHSDPDRVFKVGLLCAVAGYLATGMFNDSVTSIAPIFWTLLGLGIAMMDVDQKVG